MELQPIKVKVSESAPKPWHIGQKKYTTITGSLNKGDQDYPYTIAVYGINDYLTEVHFNNLYEAAQALVILVEETDINFNAEITKGESENRHSSYKSYSYEDACDYLNTVEKLELLLI
ncbi:hypothetical protein [Carboxylicivirga sp. RSCT41]|uniref:hypothetical protein n=1 Tax=Carboxylicivirga agarovorans TaxID=3417570 RepID=UPI003D333789